MNFTEFLDQFKFLLSALSVISVQFNTHSFCELSLLIDKKTSYSRPCRSPLKRDEDFSALG